MLVATHTISLTNNYTELLITYHRKEKDKQLYVCKVKEDDHFVKTFFSGNVKQLEHVLNSNKLTFTHNKKNNTYTLMINKNAEPTYVLTPINTTQIMEFIDTAFMFENAHNELKKELEQKNEKSTDSNKELEQNNIRLNERNSQLQERNAST